MSQLDPRAVAVQGAGFGALLLAAQGLLPADEQAAQAVDSAGAGAAIPLRRRVRRVWLQPPAVAFDEAEDELALDLLGLI